MSLDSISRRLLGFLNLGVVSLLASVLLYDRFAFPHRDVVIWVTLVVLGSILVVCILLSVVRLAIFCVRAHAQMLIGHSYEYTCQFLGNDGTLADTVRICLRNVSFTPQRIVYADSEGFAVPVDFSPEYHIQKRSRLPDGKLGIVGTKTPIPLTPHSDFASGVTIHQGMWNLFLDPPMQPFEKLSFVRHSVDRQVEERAFGSSGTDFVFRCRTPFIRLSIVVVAPQGYSFAEASRSVDNQSGKGVLLGQRVGEFRIVNDTTLTWSVFYPHPALRYKIHFTLSSISLPVRSTT
ncbi:hypothetical protein ACFLQR_02900 [Verrucomicrobiota bacterium]